MAFCQPRFFAPIAIPAMAVGAVVGVTYLCDVITTLLIAEVKLLGHVVIYVLCVAHGTDLTRFLPLVPPHVNE